MKKILAKNKTLNNKLYSEIRNILSSARANAYKAVNFSMVVAYWEIGKLLVEEEQKGKSRAEYGKNILENISKSLTEEFGKGFDITNLRRMRSFYMVFPIRAALRPELTWTHYRLLLRIENKEIMNWYIEETISQSWSSRQLERQISTFYYERILASKNKKSVKKEATEKLSEVSPEQFIKDPYVLEFLNLKNYPALHESNLEQALIDQLQLFLLELGKGFCFVARQKRMNFEDENFYIDLVFYHSILKCYVLIDLKLGKLTHSDIGQMDSYIRMFDDLYKNKDDNPTIGIILCSKKNEAVVKYSVLKEAKQIFASKYILSLPTVEQLQQKINAERKRIEKDNNIKK